MTEHLPAFRRYLAERGYSAHTARDYRTRAATFQTWLGSRPLTEAAVREYRAALRGRACARATIRGSLAALSLWFQFLQRCGLASGLPAVPSPLDPVESRQGRRWTKGRREPGASRNLTR